MALLTREIKERHLFPDTTLVINQKDEMVVSKTQERARTTRATIKRSTPQEAQLDMLEPAAITEKIASPITVKKIRRRTTASIHRRAKLITPQEARQVMLQSVAIVTDNPVKEAAEITRLTAGKTVQPTRKAITRRTVPIHLVGRIRLIP